VATCSWSCIDYVTSEPKVFYRAGSPPFPRPLRFFEGDETATFLALEEVRGASWRGCSSVPMTGHRKPCYCFWHENLH
jgi:hypothetical protein